MKGGDLFDRLIAPGEIVLPGPWEAVCLSGFTWVFIHDATGDVVPLANVQMAKV